MTKKITLNEFERKLYDLKVKDKELEAYFIGDPKNSQPFAPVFHLNRDLVEVEPEQEVRVHGAYAMGWANGVSRWRRAQHFRWRRDEGSKLPIIVAEGDSWFQFPIFLDDVVDQFIAPDDVMASEDYFDVWCVSAAGDTLENMIEAEEYIEAIGRHKSLPKAFLFSGAGNDFVGEVRGTSVVYSVIRDYQEGAPASWYLKTAAFAERLSFIETAYRTVLEKVQATFKDRVSVVIHGYDYALPLVKGDRRNPAWARDWLAGPLKKRGFPEEEMDKVGQGVIAAMIDALNEMQQRLCGGNVPGGTFPNAYHVDVRGTLPDRKQWADELHPNSAGFKKVAAKFKPVIDKALGRP